jgi:hypothetical protein
MENRFQRSLPSLRGARMPASPASEGYVLFFTPEAGVVPHFTAQAVVARTLKDRGHKILMIRCQGALVRCPVMDMYLLPFEDAIANQKQTCGQCLHVAKLFQENWGLDFVNMSELLTPELVTEVVRVMDSAPADLRELNYDGIPFGKLCVIDLVHATKTSRFDSVTPEVRSAWKQYISAALTSYLMVQRLCRELPVTAIVTHEDYSPLVAARLAGKAAGVPAVTMTICQHASGDRRRYQFFQQPAWGQAFLNIQIWPRFRDLPIPPERVEAAMDDVLDRLRAPNAHVYSPQKTFAQGDFRDQLGIPKDRKVLALFTSSLDEMIAATSQQDAIDLPRIRLTQTFKDQIEWIKAVIDFVGKEPGYHLVVRIHPREGANKREGTRSQHLLMLQQAFDREYPNCKIIWPETQVSSYDLAEIADLVLVSWSTMGIELSRLGVPILASTYGNAPRPWDDFHEWAPTPREYFRKLREMVGSEPGLDALRHAFRWYILHYFGFTIDFSDVIPAKDFHGVPPYTLPASAEQVERTILAGEDVVASYERGLRRACGPDNARTEEEALRRQARRAVHCLMTREDRTADFTLIFAGDAAAADSLSPAEQAAIAEGSMALAIDGPEGLEYRCGGTLSLRHSPMAGRLARLGSQKKLGHAEVATVDATAGNGSGSWTPAAPAPAHVQASLQAAASSAMAGTTELAAMVAKGAEAEGWDEALRQREAGNFARARGIAAQAVRAGGETPDWANFLGHLAYLEGESALAKDALLEVARRWPRFGKAHNNLAALCWADGEKALALEHMAAALELEPDQRDIILNGTRILMAMEMESEARALGEAYLRAHPGDAHLIESALGSVRTVIRA